MLSNDDNDPQKFLPILNPRRRKTGSATGIAADLQLFGIQKRYFNSETSSLHF